jgi:hypothetical protein
MVHQSAASSLRPHHAPTAPTSKGLGAASLLMVAFRSGATLACPGEDQAALEFGQAGEHGHHQLAVRRGRVRPWIGERLEARAGLADGTRAT